MTPETTKFPVAVIGCGMMGEQHADAWARRADAEVATVYDPDLARAKALAARYGASVSASWSEAVEAAAVRAVSICTPAHLHAEVALHALHAGRHVLCEKALALTLSDADAMIAAARDRGVQLATSFQYRGLGRYRRYKELLERGHLRGPLFARFVDIREVRPKLAMHRRSMNGGPVFDMAGHYIDLMHWFTGAEPTSVFATGHVFGASKARLREVTDFGCDVAEIQVRYVGGHCLSMFINWGMPEGFPSQGFESLNTSEILLTYDASGTQLITPGGSEKLELEPDPAGPEVRIADLVNAIEGREALEVRGEEGRRALGVILAALESVETGEAVRL